MINRFIYIFIKRCRQCTNDWKERKRTMYQCNDYEGKQGLCLECFYKYHHHKLLIFSVFIYWHCFVKYIDINISLYNIIFILMILKFSIVVFFLFICLLCDSMSFEWLAKKRYFPLTFSSYHNHLIKKCS